jgi:hypothetical protein
MLFAIVFVAALIGAQTAGAKTLKEPTTGLTVKAPKGYKLKLKSGVYTLSTKGRYAQFMSFRTPLSMAATGDTILAGIKAKSVKGEKATASSFKASAKVKGRPVALRINVVGGVTKLAIFGGKGGAKASAASFASSVGLPVARTAALTPREIAALTDILRTRAGEPVRDINIGIPTKHFQAPVNNGASAEVPDLPGWQYGGTDTGYLFGGHPTDGAFELGGFIFVNYPNAFTKIPGFPIALLQDPQSALTNVFPAWKKLSSNADIAFTAINPLTGTDGNLGTGFLSQAFEVTLTAGGQTFHGVFNVGVTDNAGSIFTWGFYFSYAISRVDGPSGILAALLNTWGTWNNSAASIARLESALKTIQSTRPVGGGPIDSDVFQNAADAWSEYIRGP